MSTDQTKQTYLLLTVLSESSPPIDEEELRLRMAKMGQSLFRDDFVHYPYPLPALLAQAEYSGFIERVDENWHITPAGEKAKRLALDPYFPSSKKRSLAA